MTRRDKEGAVAIKDKEDGVGNKVKVNVYLGYPFLSLKGSSLICLPSYLNWHMLDLTVNGDIFVIVYLG